MRLIFWVTALAVLSLTHAKNSTAKSKPKRQLENIRTPQNLQYSLVLPHSRVTHFRALTSSRRIAHVPTNGGKLPPYAVQMEPVVQYSQKDPLYDPNLDNLEDAGVNKNEIYAQPKILNVHDNSAEGTYGPPYGSLPTAPLYSQEPTHPHYYEAPEPIIEIIIKESNETLPAPPPTPAPKKKKEPVHVFYVKYSKDPHSKDKVIYEKPIPAITPPTNDEDDHHHEDYVTVTPEPLYIPTQTTTLRAIIKPESEVYHSDSSVKITFGNEGHHYSDRRESNSEGHEETAPRPAIAFPNPSPSHPPLQRSASPKPQNHESQTRLAANHPTPHTYRPVPQHAQSRIQFQPQYLPNEQQLPRQSPSVAPFRFQPQVNRQNQFGQSPSLNPNPNTHPSFPSASPGPITHFNNNAQTVSGPAFPSFPRQNNPPPTFHQRPSPPSFAPRPHINGPPRTSFHTGPQRPFHQPHPQSKPFFDEAKYLQENYHTITTDQVDSPKEQFAPNRQPQNFNFQARPSPSPPPAQFEEHTRPQFIPLKQQLPQQRPPQHFVDSQQSFPVNPSRPPFFNLKPSPPKIDDNRPQFQQQSQPHPQFGFHQGPQIVSQPTPQLSLQHQLSFTSSPSPSPIPQHQFLPQPSSPPLFNFHPQPSPTPAQHQFHQQVASSERPQVHQPVSPTARPSVSQQNSFQDQTNLEHQQNVGQFVPQGGEFVPSISKYEQHITVNGNESPSYSDLNGPSQPTPTATQPVQQYHQLQQKEQQKFYDAEQEQVRQQLAENVKKQQEEIQRLQTQLLLAQQQQQQQRQQQKQQQQQQHQYQQHQQQLQNQYEQNYREAQNQQYSQQTVQITSPKSQYVQERSRPQANYVTSTPSPTYYQSTSRTVEIKPTTQKYSSSTVNSISSTQEPKKEEKKKKKPQIELPDEVPDDLRQQLLSSGILDNADISILDYDKVGDTPLESLPPDQLANFFSAGGGQQIASTELKPIVVKPNGDQIESRIDEDIEDDQDIAASENVATYVAPPQSQKQAVEMKVVHFDPKTAEGQNIAKEYVKEDATQVEPVALNDKKYNRYLPLKVSGNQFPLPDILKGRKVTSVVVLAPVETADLSKDHTRSERATSNSLKGIKFVAGESLQDLLKRPTTDNFQKWLEVEKKTAADLQSVILLVTGNDESTDDREIYMYDISTGNVNKLNGELSNAFVEAAENNSLSKDIEKLAIEGEGIPENFDKDNVTADGSENVPFLVDLSGLSLDQEDSNQVSISSGYSKTKHGRSLRKQ